MLDAFVLLTPLIFGIAALVLITRLPPGAKPAAPKACFRTADLWSLLIPFLGVAVLGILADRYNLLVVGFLTPILLLQWWVSVRHLERAGVLNGERRITFTLLILPLTMILVAHFIAYGGYAWRLFVLLTAAELWPEHYQNLGVGLRPSAAQLGRIVGGATLYLMAAALMRLLNYQLMSRDGARNP